MFVNEHAVRDATASSESKEMINGEEVKHPATQAHGAASRERLIATLNHKQPDRIPIDFGGTSVTGIHASCVAALRDYYGLEKRPVRIHEPSQMLGQVDDDLKEAMGVDVVCVFRRGTKWGVPAEGWKPWLFNGLEVLVPGEFNTTVDSNGDTLVYPEGDTTVAASGRMPKGGYFFDCIVRQEPIDEEHLNPEDNMEEFGSNLAETDLDYLAQAAKRRPRPGAARLRALAERPLATLRWFRDRFSSIPKAFATLTEWYVSTRSRQDYIHKVFERQCEIALGIWSAFMRRSATRCRRSSSAARTSARKPPHSAR